MAKQLISKASLRALQEYLVAFSVVGEIQELFDDAGIVENSDFDKSQESSVRRGFIKSYYASVNLSEWSDVQKLLGVFEVVLVEMKTADWDGYHGEKQKKEYERLLQYLERDGFILEDNRLRSVSSGPQLKTMQKHANYFDAHHLHDQIKRLEGSIQDNSWQAIGTSKELVETTCKTILAERGITVERSWDTGKLVKQTCKVLQLTPDDIPDSAKAAKTIKVLLSNLATIVQGLSELRNVYGYGHGPEGRAKGLPTRHARLAVGAASTLSTFLFDSHMEK